MREEQLIFIASQPRAGSTYLQNVLSNNPITNTTSEPWIMLSVAPLLKPDLVYETSYNHKLAIKAVNIYQSKTGTDLKAEIKSLALNMYAPMLEGFDYVIDKTPRYWELLDELVALFPKSKIVVIRRNPIDVVKSIIKTWNKETIEQLNDYRSDLLKAPFVIDAFLEKHQNNKNVIAINYQDVISNRETVVKKLYSDLGLPYSELVLDTSKNEKFKGFFGDPYQNNTSKVNKILPNFFDDFITGYGFYLGENYFKKHNFEYEKIAKTRSFEYFLNLEQQGTIPSVKTLLKGLKLYIKRKLIYFKN